MKIVEIKKFFPLAILVFLAVFAYPAFKMLSMHSGGDLGTGIYSQAMNQFSFKNLDPLLSLSGTNFFGVHFQPIIILLSFMAKFFSPVIALHIAEIAFFILAALPIIFINDRKKLGVRVTVIAVFYLLFNKGVVTNIGGEINTLEWGILPMGLLFYFISFNNKQGVFWSIFFLMLLGEQFALLSIGVVIYYYIKKENLSLHRGRNKKFANVIAIFSLLWFGGAFYLSGMDEMRFIPRPSYDAAQWRMILELLLPLIPLAFVNWKYKDGINMKVFWISLPLLLYVILNGLWTSVHAAYIPMILIFIVLPANLKGTGMVTNTTFVQTLVCFILIAAMNIFNVWDNVNIVLNKGESNQCPTNRERVKAIAEATHFLNFNQEGTVLVEANG